MLYTVLSIFLAHYWKNRYTHTDISDIACQLFDDMFQFVITWGECENIFLWTSSLAHAGRIDFLILVEVI